MKILVLALFLFTFNSAVCQDTENNIQYNAIHIINAAKKSYSLGSSNDLQKAFGKIQAKKTIDEIDEGFAFTYKYKGLLVEFHEHEFDAATINGPQYAALLNGIAYKVGDPVSKLKNSFPASYKSKQNGFLRIGIENKNIQTDTFIIINYNVNGRITQIWIGTNNS